MTSVFPTTQVSCPHILPYLVEPFTWRNPTQLKLFLHTLLFFLPASPLLTTVLNPACILSMHVFISLTLPCVIITIHKFNAHFYSNKTYHILHNLLWLAFFFTQNHIWGLPITVHLDGGHSMWLLTAEIPWNDCSTSSLPLLVAMGFVSDFLLLQTMPRWSRLNLSEPLFLYR